MQYLFNTHRWVLASLVMSITPAALADDNNLIQTLYNSAPEELEYDGEPQFVLNGELGVINATGNTNATSIKAGITSEHETRHWNNNYYAELLYKESEVDDKRGEVTAQRFYGYAQFDYKLRNEGQRTFMYADYENDRFNGYNYRASLAAGWSQRLWKEDESTFRYSVGPGYAFVSAEDGTDSNVNDGFVVRTSAEYQYEWNTGAKFRQFGSAEVGADYVRTRSETALSANLFDTLAMKMTFVLVYETAPLIDASSLNTETTLSIVYRFF